MSGRKPKPTLLKLLAGNPGKRPLNKNEPQTHCEIPSCPEVLQGVAREEWGRITEELFSMGLIDRVSRAAVAGYCEHYEQWVNASAQVRKFGTVIKSPNGYPVQSPYLGIMNTALSEMRKFMTEFGMTPSSRSRVSSNKDNNAKESPLAKFQRVK
jgi:P27 family predicted phage terminase small subunit